MSVSTRSNIEKRKQPNSSKCLNVNEPRIQSTYPTVSKSKFIPKGPESCGSVFAIILPLILDETKKNMNQPVLVSLKKRDLKSNGFYTNENLFFDETLNLFFTKIKWLKFSFRIIAIGDNFESLRESLGKNIKKNQAWKSLKKLLNYTCENLEFEQDPSALLEEELPYVLMTESEMSKVFAKVVKDSTVIEKLSDGKDSEVDNSSQTESFSTLPDTQEPKEAAVVNSFCYPEKQNVESESSKKILISKFQSKMEEIQRKKTLLSEFNGTDMIVRLMIDHLNDLTEFVCDKYGESRKKIYRINPIDKTYKKESKNQVLVEGKLTLKLDGYKQALKQPKASEASSFAYQLIRLSFPESYIRKAVVGKKYYSHEELDQIHKNKDKCDKFPLVFIFGYMKAFDEPFKGDFDPRLGEERILALYDHIFRMTGSQEYTDEMLKQVRDRIMRILCTLNGKKEGEKDSRKKMKVGNSIEEESHDSNGPHLPESQDLDSESSNQSDFWPAEFKSKN